MSNAVSGLRLRVEREGKAEVEGKRTKTKSKDKQRKRTGKGKEQFHKQMIMHPPDPAEKNASILAIP